MIGRCGTVMSAAGVAGLFLLSGCVSHQRVAPLRDAGRHTIYVLTETGLDSTAEAREARQRKQVRDWMERDLVRLLRKRGGYQAESVASRESFTPAPDRYLLHVRITQYKAGSKAARALVGYGAGAVSLDTAYELYGAEAEPLLKGRQGVGSSRDWYQCVRKVNQLTLDDVTRALRESSSAKR
jgi:hypothetical protein